MPRYLLRAIRQVVVYEITGQEQTIDCDNDAQAHLAAVRFAAEEFPGKVDMEVEIKKMNEAGPEPVLTPESEQRDDTNYGSPF
jgi:hypothetical protein